MQIVAMKAVRPEGCGVGQQEAAMETDIYMREYIYSAQQTMGHDGPMMAITFVYRWWWRKIADGFLLLMVVVVVVVMSKWPVGQLLATGHHCVLWIEHWYNFPNFLIFYSIPYRKGQKEII